MEDIEFLHHESIERYGGTLGVRDRATLESAVNHPKNIFYYGQGDIFDVAAGYAFHIAQAQALLDGNKRTAVAAAVLFLEVNGITVSVPWQTLYTAIINITERRSSRVELAQIFRRGSE
jgi:death on curing protein